MNKAAAWAPWPPGGPQKRYWFEVSNYINTGMDDPLNGAPDQILNVICLNRASLIIQNGLRVDV